MNNKKISLILGVMCLALVAAICVQVRTVKESNVVVSQSYEENNLRAEVLKYKEKYDNKYAELERAEAELEKERESSTQNDDRLTKMENQIKDGNKIAGFTDVTGKGVVVTLKDSQITSNSTTQLLNVSDMLVHDMDILSVINELKNAGAEAISINDQRLVNTSSIVCGGNIIAINSEKVGAPFVIKAIGLPEQLAALSRPGGYLSILNEYGIGTTLKKMDQVSILKYPGVIEFKYAQPVK